MAEPAAALSRSVVGSAADPTLSPTQRAILTVGSNACVLMSKVSRRVKMSRTERYLARLDNDSCISNRMVPGCRRTSWKTSVTAGSPGSPWMGLPSTSSEVMMAPWFFSGDTSHC